MFGEFLDGHRLVVGQGMVLRRDHDQLFIEERLRGEVGVQDRAVEDGEVDLTGAEEGVQRARGRIDEDWVEAGIVASQALQQGGGHPAGGGADAADPNRSADLLAHGRDVVLEGLHLAADALCPIDDRLALGGGEHGPSVDEHGVQLLFESCDVCGHVGLHRVERTGGRGEAPMLGHGHQVGELAQVHR